MNSEGRQKKTCTSMTNSNLAPEVTLFREYLRIKTVHPTPDFEGAVNFLKRQADEIGLEFSTYEV